MNSFDEMIKTVKCCHCSHPMLHSAHVNIVMLDRRAQWLFPVANNVLKPYPYNQAVAFMCSICFDNKVLPKFAVEFKDNQVIYHEIDKLEKMDRLASESTTVE